MNETYEVVPNVISCKDLDYLTDMFNWNYGAYKSNYNAKSEVTDAELVEMLEKSSDIFYNNMTKILNIINGGINE